MGIEVLAESIGSVATSIGIGAGGAASSVGAGAGAFAEGALSAPIIGLSHAPATFGGEINTAAVPEVFNLGLEGVNLDPDIGFYDPIDVIGEASHIANRVWNKPFAQPISAIESNLLPGYDAVTDAELILYQARLHIVGEKKSDYQSEDLLSAGDILPEANHFFGIEEPEVKLEKAISEEVDNEAKQWYIVSETPLSTLAIAEEEDEDELELVAARAKIQKLSTLKPTIDITHIYTTDIETITDPGLKSEAILGVSTAAQVQTENLVSNKAAQTRAITEIEQQDTEQISVDSGKNKQEEDTKDILNQQRIGLVEDEIKTETRQALLEQAFQEVAEEIAQEAEDEEDGQGLEEIDGWRAINKLTPLTHADRSETVNQEDPQNTIRDELWENTKAEIRSRRFSTLDEARTVSFRINKKNRPEKWGKGDNISEEEHARIHKGHNHSSRKPVKIFEEREVKKRITVIKQSEMNKDINPAMQKAVKKPQNMDGKIGNEYPLEELAA